MREFRLIEEAIEKFELNLEEYTVLTEAATGHFIWTPIIAALSGGDVIAFSSDSRYGTFEEVKEMTGRYAQALGVKENITITNQLTGDMIATADIITNTGFLRPLNEEKLKHCKETTVIPLMYETWEFREEDLDLEYCRLREIPVMGTNESDPRLETMDYLGAVAMKAMFQNGLEVCRSRIAILGRGRFAQSVYRSLVSQADWIEIWNEQKDVDADRISRLDCLIIADHESGEIWIGEGGLISTDVLKASNSDIRIIHISGVIDSLEISEKNIHLYPDIIAKDRWMSLTTAYAGPKPVIDLHTAGLKVGEGLCEAVAGNLSPEELKEFMVKNYPVTTFN